MGRLRLVAFLDRLATPAGVACLLAVHVLAHGLLRYVFGTGLELDDAEAAALMQHTLLPAYQTRNPPLYEWLLWGMEQLTGPGPLAHILLRHILIFGVGVMALQLGRRLLGRQAAGLLLLSLFLTVWFPLNFLFWGTHTLLLATAVLGWCAALIEWRSTRSHAALAGLVGFALIGCLGKWSFPLLPLASAASLAVDRAGRAALADRRLLAIPLVLVVAAGPVFSAIWLHGGDVVTMSAVNLAGEPKAWLTRVIAALWRLPVSYVLFLMPWAVIAALVMWRAPKRGQLSDDTRLILRLSVILLVGSWIAAVVAGAANLNEHYMYALALPMLVGGVGVLVTRSRLDVLKRLFAAGALAVVVVVFAVRTVGYTAGGFPLGKQNKHLVPYPALAAELIANGYGDAAFIAESNTLAGNLITFLPSAVAVSPVSYGFPRRPADLPRRRCAAIWMLWAHPVGSATTAIVAPPGSLAVLVPPSTPRHVVTTPWSPTLLGARRLSNWAIADLEPAACDAVYGGLVAN